MTALQYCAMPGCATLDRPHLSEISEMRTDEPIENWLATELPKAVQRLLLAIRMVEIQLNDPRPSDDRLQQVLRDDIARLHLQITDIGSMIANVLEITTLARRERETLIRENDIAYQQIAQLRDELGKIGRKAFWARSDKPTVEK